MKIPRKNTPASAIRAETVIASAAFEAGALVACGDGFIPDAPSDVPSVGAAFKIPLLIPEETATGDNREFEYKSLTSRDFPLPLYWQIATGEGHSGSVIVGRIDYAERIGDHEAPDTIDEADSVGEIVENIDDGVVAHETGLRGWGNAYGVFDTGPYGREAERLVRGGFLRGVSADLDKFEAALELAAEDEDEDSSGKIKNDKLSVTSARLMGATLLGKPAFQECVIELDDEILDVEVLEDGLYEEDYEDPELIESAILASAAPVIPPRNWFSNPRLDKPTPMTIDEQGRVFGHIASWETNHIGYGNKSVAPPRSRSGYAYFRTGVLRTDDGSDVPVGQLTLAGGHASMTASHTQAVKHYDDTASAVADVSAGEDAFGIWVAGSLRPDITAAQVRALRASAPSGDWRPINGRLELVAVCQVNVPGFPLARAMVAGGQVMALVAAGARPLIELRENKVDDLANRVAMIERKELEATVASARELLAPLKQETDEALVAAAAAARDAVSPLVNTEKQKIAEQAEAARRMMGF